ncbi:MAG: hypothetical protein H6993_08870 [Pseudomonadales bacterium]|nr:hypothetical protein [Pseudomonadales bacterium]
MNWEAVGALSEVVGAIAVVVTLFYLAVQTKRNTSAILNESARAAETTISEFHRELARDPDLLKVIVKSYESDGTNYSSEEWHRFTQLGRAWLHIMQMQYLQHTLGSAPSEQVAAHLRIIRTYSVKLPVWKIFWEAEQQSGAWLPGFVEAVDRTEIGSMGSSGQLPNDKPAT